MQVLLFRHTKQTSKNVTDLTFKGEKIIFHDQYVLERYPKLGRQSGIKNSSRYYIYICKIFERYSWCKYFFWRRKHCNSNINILSSRQLEVFGKKFILKSFIKLLKITLREEDHFILVKSQAL